MQMKYWFIALLLLTGNLFSQQVTVSASIDSQSVSIGDWIRYSVRINHSSNVPVSIPTFKDTIGIFEIVQQDSATQTELNGNVEIAKNFIIAKYEAGNFYIQPFAVQFKDEKGKIQTAQSNPIPVEIRGIEIDTTMSIKDVKPQLTVPISAEEIALYTAIVLVLAGLGYGLYYYLTKRRKKTSEIIEAAKPNIPPHVLALMQLEELEAKGLWRAGEFKIFYSEATEIIRRYFELRYGIMALEMTTGEVMVQLERFKFEKSVFVSIELFLSSADLVKFAKYQPIVTENEQVINNARMIVEKTKPELIDQASEKESSTITQELQNTGN